MATDVKRPSTYPSTSRSTRNRKIYFDKSWKIDTWLWHYSPNTVATSTVTKILNSSTHSQWTFEDLSKFFGIAPD